MERKCKGCGIDISDKHINALFCSVSCRNLYKTKIESEEKYKDDPDVAICKICGLKGKNLCTHIHRIHNMNTAEYMERFNVTKEDIYSKNYLDGCSERLKGEKNPGYNHGGSLSPYSKKFVKYENLSEEEKDGKIFKMYENLSEKLKEGDKLPNQIGYWLNKGFSENEAKAKVTERQTTFNLEICIEKYGEEEGTKRWKERQEKWQDTLNSKLPEELERINKAKVPTKLRKRGYSNVSQDLFWKVYENIKISFKKIYFAQLNKNKDMDASGRNYEYVLRTDTNDIVFPDFLVLDNKKVIEFDGDYWHGEKRGNKQREEQRDRMIEKGGFEILHIKERDYKQDPEKIIMECVNFINE